MASDFDPNENDSISEINITPFVDVVLVLLVIFMVTAPMITKESLGIKLPKSKSSTPTSQEVLSVGISKVGQILFNGEIVDKELLYQKATEIKKKNPNIKLIISADKDSLHGDTITVLDQVKKAGIHNFAFQIEKIQDE